MLDTHGVQHLGMEPLWVGSKLQQVGQEGPPGCCRPRLGTQLSTSLACQQRAPIGAAGDPGGSLAGGPQALCSPLAIQGLRAAG